MSAIDRTRGRLAIWASHTVRGGAGTEQRWYQVDPEARTILQSGVVSSPTKFVYNGAIAPDRAVTAEVDEDGSVSYPGRFGSGMVMGVTTSGPASFPGVEMVSKPAGGPQSALTLVKESPGPYADAVCALNTAFAIDPSCRWGDYSGASPDPTPPPGDTGVVWLTNEWTMGSVDTRVLSSWRTWIWRATP